MKIAEEDTSTWKCVVCGCTDTTPCPGGCRWVRKNLCSSCVPLPFAYNTYMKVKYGLRWSLMESILLDAEISLMALEKSISALKRIIETYTQLGNDFGTEVLLFKGMLSDYEKIMDVQKAVCNKIREYFEIKGKTPS